MRKAACVDLLVIPSAAEKLPAAGVGGEDGEAAVERRQEILVRDAPKGSQAGEGRAIGLAEEKGGTGRQEKLRDAGWGLKWQAFRDCLFEQRDTSVSKHYPT